MSFRRLPIALALVPLALGVVSGLSLSADAPDCSEARPTQAVPMDDIGAMLDRLHALYAGLDGFVDVYYYPGHPVEFRPMFIGSVPEAARAVETPVPIAFDVIESAPQDMGPGPAPDAGDILCTGIRPGSWISAGGACTTNFVFTDPQGNLYIGTAGHCISTGQTAVVANVGLIGTAVFSTGDGGVGNDFALIKINADKMSLVNPEMCDWGGPTGVFTGPSITGRRVLHTGHGYGVVGSAVVTPMPPRPKEGVGEAWGATSLTWVGYPWPGDSGSAIRLDGGTSVGTVGLGAGILTHGIGVSVVGAPAGLGFGTRLDKAIQMSGINGLQLVTVPYAHLV
jgi:hypothetical protein